MNCSQHRQFENRRTCQSPSLDIPDGIPQLLSLYIYVSGTCNLSCRHCWIDPDLETKNNEGSYVDLFQVRKAVKVAKTLGLSTVKLTGGEPLLHPQFKRLVDFLADERLSIMLETNGTLVNRELAEYLKKTEAVNFVSVSIDGIDKTTHEKLRGVKGCFELAVRGLSYLVDAGFRPQLICSLHRGNVDQCEELIEKAEEMGCGSIKFNRIQRMGRGSAFFENNGLEIIETIKLGRYIEKEIEPKSSIGIHFDMPVSFCSVGRLLKGNIGRCAILNILGLLPNGVISICGIGKYVPELSFGNIAEDSIREVWINSPGLEKVRKLIPGKLEGICSRCIHRDSCLGACVANNFVRKGRLNASYEFCSIAEKLGLFPISRKRISEKIT